MVHHYGLWKNELGNYMIEHEKSSGGVIVRKGRKSFNPFSEVVNNHDDVSMTIS
jgi:hypothetical protein